MDTLGAGDVLHGAYAYALAVGLPRLDALRLAVRVAALRVTIPGPGWSRDPRFREAGRPAMTRPLKPSADAPPPPDAAAPGGPTTPR